IDRTELERRDTSTEDKGKYKLILPGDIGYNTMRMWQGVCGLSKLRGIVSPAYTIVTPRPNRIVGEFAAALFKTPRMIHQFRRYSQGLVDDTLSLKFPQFAEIRISIPPISEQSRIAEATTLLASEVSILTSELEALRRQRLGLLQKLIASACRNDDG